MSDPSRPSPAGAGLTLVGTMLLFGAAGLALGDPFDLSVPLGLAGLFAGLLAGFGLVYSRFRDL